MELFLDEFERERTRHFSFRVDPDEGNTLFGEVDLELAGPIEVDVEVERVNSTFVVEGDVSADIKFECGRCLRERVKSFSLHTQWVLMSPEVWHLEYGGDDEVELNEDDLDVSFYEGDSIVLDELVREALLLEVSGQLKCADDDSGCEAAYREHVGEETLEDNEDAGIDLRWAPLQDIKLANNDE